MPKPGASGSVRRPSSGIGSPSRSAPKTGATERPSGLAATYSQSVGAVWAAMKW